MKDRAGIEQSIETQPSKSYAEGAVRLFSVGSNQRTEIDIPEGTVIVVKRTPTPKDLNPFVQIDIRKGERRKTILDITPDYSQGMAVYRFFGPAMSDNVGVFQGENLDLALADRLGVEDPDLKRDAGQYLVTDPVIVRIKFSFVST